MAKTISLTVNGKIVLGRGWSRELCLAHFLRDGCRLDRHSFGLRRRPLRCVYRDVERHGGEIRAWSSPSKLTATKSSPSKVWRRTSDCIRLQEAFWKNDAVECGYCTPGMLMSAYGLLSKGSKAD